MVQCNLPKRCGPGLLACSEWVHGHGSWKHGSQASPLNVLSESECELVARFRHGPRRRQWLAGRRLAKQLIAQHLGNSACVLDPRSIYIQSTDAVGRSVRPRVYLDGRLQDWSLSISHTESVVFVALAAQRGVSVGVDVLETQGPNRDRLGVWMTPRERDSFTGDWCAARAWAVKEAVYKATNRGESFAPGNLEVFHDRRGQISCRLPGGQQQSTLQINSHESAGHFFVLATASTFEEALS